MSVKAITRGVRISPRKVGAIVGLVRGRSVADALTILEHTPRRSAEPLRKTINSARANAEHNHGFKPDTLYISEVSVTAGPRLKRWSRGHGYRGGVDPFQRKSSHIRVVVDGEKRPLKKPKAETAKETK